MKYVTVEIFFVIGFACSKKCHCFLCFARTIVEEYNESCSDDDDRLTQRYETKAPNERLSFVISNDRYHEQYLVNKQEIINKFADPFIRIQLCVVCPCIVISIST